MIFSMVVKQTIILLLLLFLHHIASANEQAIISRRRQELRQDKATLLAFKNSITTHLPSVLADWNESNNNVCNFTGVTCNRWHHQVVRLNLSKMLISGNIPPVVGNLTGLLSLDLTGNLLTGQIPAELSRLHHLLVLILADNQLHGPIPESLAALGKVYFVDLKQNHLSGHIPAPLLRNCSLLGVLDLSDNALSGEIPTSSSIYLVRLAVLYLYSNSLTGRLPRWLSNCTHLFGLDVENNSLADELPTDIISDKKQLSYLHLSNNRFWSHDGNTNLEPFFAAISNCSKIQEIEIGGVGLCGQLPNRLGSMLPGLSHLNLEENMIHGPIPPDISDIINITLLNLSSNHLNGTIPASICRLQMLERLVLSDNYLTGAIPSEIGNITRLGELDLSGNTLSGSIPSSIGNLSQMNHIYLQRNRLSGEIPVSLGRCIGLLDLDLSSNSLTGIIPEEISGIVKISLNLSHNQLQGPLPIGLSNMQQVQQIDMSSNNLTGAIIPQLSACAAVMLIDLSHNSLQGGLPDSFGYLRNLESLDVSFNDLSGEIPLSLSKCTNLTHLNLSCNDFSGYIPTGGIFSLFTNLSYLGNRHLCGQLIGRPCTKHHNWEQSRKFLIIMSICASVLAFLLTICCVISIRKLRERFATMKKDIFRGGSSPVMKSKYPRITYRELVEATDEFSQQRLIGSSSYGRVYRGALRDGTMVAVKVLQLQTGNSTKSFNRECQVLKRIRHRNLMRIITACSLPDFKALVLPFMANGSLERCLYSGSAELSLIQRVNICSDIAEGMAYLHHHSPVKVIHCDLKPSNVLINDDMTALVSDFGISRLVMNVGGVNTVDVGASTANMLCGSIGYIPPEYGYGSNPTTKGDVYSFGVLVLELVTKRKPTDDMFEGGLSLHKWVKNHYHGRADMIIDPALVHMVRDQTPEVRRMWDVAISELVELGMLCTQENASIRPTMMDAADDLDRLKRYLGGDTTATFASSLGFSSTTIEDD